MLRPVEQIRRFIMARGSSKSPFSAAGGAGVNRSGVDRHAFGNANRTGVGRSAASNPNKVGSAAGSQSHAAQRAVSRGSAKRS